MTTLEQKVMARVRRIYYMRKLFGPTAIKLYTMSGILVGLLSLVSVANVLANMSSLKAPSDAILYLSRAALQTEPVVQLLLVGLALMLALMVRDILRTFRSVRVGSDTPLAHI